MNSKFDISRRELIMAGAAAAIVAGGTGPALAQTGAKPAPKGQAILGFSQEIKVLNPHAFALIVDRAIWPALYDQLWEIDAKGNYVPKLAKEVPSLENGGISKDGLTWTVKLRENIKWHDGKPFTADDVKFNLELLNAPNFKAMSRRGHELIKEIKVLGPHEVSWTMSQPFAPYLSLMAWVFLVPKHAFDGVDPNEAPFNNAPIGTGPFRWGEKVAGNQILLRANTEYWGEGPYLERLVFKYIPDATAMYAQFKGGQIDYIGIRGILPNLYAEAKALPGRKVTSNAGASVEGIAFNLSNPVLADKAVRQALYFAINKSVIIDIVTEGTALPAESVYPSSSWAYNDKIPPHQFDLARANALLDQAGWVRGADGIRSKGGKRLEFAVSSTSGDEIREQIEQILVQDWQKIGVSLKVDNKAAAFLFGSFLQKSQFEAMLTTANYFLGEDPDCSARFSASSIPNKTGSGSNYYYYENAEADQLLAKGVVTFDRGERKAIYARVQELLREDLPILPIYRPAVIEGTKANLTGYVDNPNMPNNVWNVGTWRLVG
ncbi:peptide ABC transporter substrate-binding protein (plasmid) [Bosea sp. F3-2]|uniref:peptide ABC transporter substrate-binding protein n=1 Tax=Bosea sp. F3-2 TaxID=2599640 RepID=UPI0011EE1FA1|nr:peptide ABC transporter substrate-binding protein [Bosea sp. F3-2]QEL27350.1 peptide ABC transporter substrate-binding protein [Bosea sp. F3-2]